MSDFDTLFKQFKDNTKPMCELMGCPELAEDFIVDVESNRQSFKSFYEAGQQSRQDEIDELHKRIKLALGALESTPYWGRSGNCEPAISILKNTEE